MLGTIHYLGMSIAYSCGFNEISYEAIALFSGSQNWILYEPMASGWALATQQC